MKIGINTPGWPHTNYPNGITKYVSNIKDGLEELGHSVTLLVDSTDNSIIDPKIIRIFSFIKKRTYKDKIVRKLFPEYYNQKYILDAFTLLARSNKLDNLDLVEMTDFRGWGKAMRIVLDIPVVVRLHGPWFLNGVANGEDKNIGYIKRVRAEGEAIGYVDGITAPSYDVLERTKKYYNLQLSNSCVIPNPCISVNGNNKWNMSSNEKNTLLFVGRFDSHKGGDIVIKAFLLAKRKFRDLKLLFVGPDIGITNSEGKKIGINEFISKYAESLDVADSIGWLGQLPFHEIELFRKKAAITLMSSRYENFGSVLLEAIAYGCPVIASDSGGTPEIVKDGLNGLLFKSEDPADLADKIIYLLKNPSAGEKLGRYAYQDARVRFDKNKLAERHIEFYKKILK